MNRIPSMLAVLIVFFMIGTPTFAQEFFPPHWFVNMRWNKVQVLAYSKSIPFSNPGFKVQYPGVVLERADVLENAKYAALTFVIDASTKPGAVVVEYQQGKKKMQLSWSLKERRAGKGTSFANGISSADVVYLLMPDRFSNGNPANDRVPGMRDQSLNRDSIYYRHGGDIQGVINHLDYLQSLGITAVWMTPVLENNMPDRTEHGYAFTNHYKIDPRHGGEPAYKQLSDELHKRGMKLVQDAVYNHVGLYHVMVQDKPVKDWLHEWPTYTQTNYKDAVLLDPHASAADKKVMSDGWFTPNMPDLNHENPLVENFLIQHALWSVEEFGVDAWRIDTYIYNNLEFMNRCNQALKDEYPSLFLFGESWVHGTANQAYFTRNNLNTAFKCNVEGVTDFQSLFYGITPSLENPNDGLNKLYLNYSNDFLYQNPMNMVTFLDNHDLNRFYTQVGLDAKKQKMGLGWLLTARGIPQIYYGTEVLMKGASWPRDGWVRLDFPGGWPGDKKNAFTQEGLTDEEKDTQNFVKALGTFRKTSSAIKSGAMRQYLPKNGFYVYFRYDANQTVMVVLNPSDKTQNLTMDDYVESTKGFTTGRNVIDNTTVNRLFTVAPKTITILELM